MRIGIFLVAAIVLIVFGIIAAAGTSAMLFGTTWYIWFMASFLAYLTDLLVGWGYADGAWGRRGAPTQPAMSVLIVVLVVVAIVVGVVYVVRR